MSWIKLDDQFFAHPKVVNLNKDAKLLYLAGLTYCGGQLTDGRITAGGLRVILALVEVKRPAVDVLVAAGLWEIGADGTYLVHDYLEYNPSAAKVHQERTKIAERQAGWRRHHQAERVSVDNGGSAITNGVSHPVSNGVTAPVTNGVSHAEPTALVTGAPYRSRIDPVVDPSLPVDHPSPPSGAAPSARGCVATRPPEKQAITGPADNFTPFADRCWMAYPLRNGRRLHKQDFLRRLKAIPSRDWEALEAAIGHYAASSPATRGYAEDPHRFLTHWQDWSEPEGSAQPARSASTSVPQFTPQQIRLEQRRRDREQAAAEGSAIAHGSDPPQPDRATEQLRLVGRDARVV